MKRGLKITGGKYKKQRKKRKYEIKRKGIEVKLGKVKKKKLRIQGGRIKTILLSSDIVNLIDKKTGKGKKAKIKNVLETPSNKFLARQNILIKGAIIETDAGKARITNRPGQEAAIEGILIE